MADLWSARVYKARDIFDRDTPVVVHKRLEVDGWEAHITVGDVPEAVARAMTIERVAINSLLDNATIPKGDDHLAARDAYIDKQVADILAADASKRQPYFLYTTIRITRSVDVDVDPNRGASSYFWFDLNSAARAATRNQDSRDRALQKITWHLLEHLDPDLLGGDPRPSRFFVEAEGKPPCPIPRFEAGAISVSRGRPMEDIGDQISRLEASNSVPNKESTLIRVSRFMMEQARETDPLKKFIWCYAGLETAAGGLYRDLKCDAKRALRVDTAAAGLIEGAAVIELVWPDNEAPESRRAIVFRFAIMALLLSPTTASRDVEDFKAVNTYRNRLHGSIDLGAAAPPTDQVARLLNWYYPRVAGFLRVSLAR